MAASAAGSKPAEQARLPGGLGGDAVVATVEELRKESELEALEAGLEAKFEAIRSRSASAHVVPSHCGELILILLLFLSIFILYNFIMEI